MPRTTAGTHYRMKTCAKDVFVALATVALLSGCSIFQGTPERSLNFQVAEIVSLSCSHGGTASPMEQTSGLLESLNPNAILTITSDNGDGGSGDESDPLLTTVTRLVDACLQLLEVEDRSLGE